MEKDFSVYVSKILSYSHYYILRKQEIKKLGSEKWESRKRGEKCEISILTSRIIVHYPTSHVSFRK